MSAWRRRWWDVLVPLLLLAAAAAITTYRLGAQSLWLDEGYTAWYVSAHFTGQLIGDLLSPTQAYPLYHLVLKLATRLWGDSEWALRLPSAAAGALCVPAAYGLGRELRDRWLGLAAALLLLAAPFAVWQAQDAKAYSLTLLTALVLWWAVARALRTNGRASWLALALVVLVAPFVHRLLVIVVLGGAVAVVVARLTGRRRALGLAALALFGLAFTAALSASLRRQGAGAQFSAAGPLTALQITATKFALDRGPADLARRWWLPFAALAALGGWGWLGRLRDPATRPAARLWAIMGGVPLAMFGLLLAVQRLYEPRYVIILFPAWLLLLAGGVALPWRIANPRPARLLLRAVAVLALLGVGWAEQMALFQPGKGLFSGAAVKEDYRGAVAQLAAHIHPDDLVIVHPDAIAPLYDYYRQRVSRQPLPDATVFSPLERAKGFEKYELNTRIGPALQTHKRAWLLIAPDHANLVDPPPTAADEVGWVGLAFQFADSNGRIPCANPSPERFNGVWLYCNNMPEIQGVTPQPATPLGADFGDQLRLRGVTITPFAGGPHPGGTLPVTLFWEPLHSLAGTDSQVFVHLTRPNDPTVLAQTDGRPMEGGQPTSRWTKPHVLLHDDRTLPLPADLAPGEYVVRVGVYEFRDGAIQRLAAQTALPSSDNSVVIAHVTVTAAP